MQLSDYLPGHSAERPLSVGEALASYKRFAKSLGYPYYHVSLRIERSSAGPLEAVLANVPLRWERAKAASGLPDPTLRRMQVSPEPFGWDEISREPADVAAFFAIARANGLHDGMSMRVPATGNDACVVTFAGAPPPAIGAERDSQFAVIWMHAIRMFGRVRGLLNRLELLRDGEQLTPKQRRVLVRIAKGKSLTEIAEELGVHRRTVEDTLRKSIEVLGVGSREMALLRAYATGQLQGEAPTEVVQLREFPWLNH